MIIDKLKRVPATRSVFRKVINIFTNRLERTPIKDTLQSNYKIIQLRPALFGQKNLPRRDAKKLHGIVLEAFEHLCDPKDKGDLKYLKFRQFRQSLKSFSDNIMGNKNFLVRDKDNNIAGFYQYAYDINSLYIQNLVLPKELRNTKKAPVILKKVINNIVNTAKKLKYDKITLHVDARNESLVKSYEKLGFRIKRIEEGFYLNNTPAYYMEANL